jgi:hypothetical protein
MKAAIFLTVFLMTGGGVAAQGKFAPPQMKSWIGKVIADETELPGFSEYQSRGGSVITDADDPEPLSVNWFSKPNSIVVFLLEIKNTTQGQEIKAGDCRDGESDNSGIVALVQPSSAKRVKAIRAWLFNRDKKRIEAWSAQNVTCLGMVGED